MTDIDLEKTAMSMAGEGEKTQVVSSAIGEPTQFAVSVECPVCHTCNSPSETYCVDCGFMLSSQPVEMEETNTPRMAGKLVSRDGTREFILRVGVNTVGRENADVLLLDNTVSRQHATITIDESGAFVNDLGSTNGTTINGVRSEAGKENKLTDGCEIAFGSTVLCYMATEPFVQPDEESVQTAAEEESEAVVNADQTFKQVARKDERAQPVAESESSCEDTTECEKLTPAIARLVAKDGSLSFDLRPGTYTIGRWQCDNDFVVPDPYCSGRHAEIKCDETGITITDKASTNGTFVNGARLETGEPQFVAAGDEITIGRVVFSIEVQGL